MKLQGYALHYNYGYTGTHIHTVNLQYGFVGLCTERIQQSFLPQYKEIFMYGTKISVRDSVTQLK